MRKGYEQMSLLNTYNEVSAAAIETKDGFFELLDKHIKWDELIPGKFRLHFYKRMGRSHAYELESLIKALVLQRVFGYTEDSQLLATLRYSGEMRDFCGFEKVPDASKLTRFKQDYCDDLKAFFSHLVEVTDPICQKMNSILADSLVVDTTGIESYVSENNPKFMNTKLRQAKAIAKNNPGFNPYKGVYALLPDCAVSNPAVNQQYINGHYCYAQKAVVVTNGLGIVRHLDLLDADFKNRHPEMVLAKRSDNPDKDKEIGDSTALKPTLDDFFLLHPSRTYSTFMGDSSFDSYDIYGALLEKYKFSRAVIPLNPRNSKAATTDFNEDGTPLCPHDGTPMTCAGICRGESRSVRFKWVCHKSMPMGNTRVCTCENPCTTSAYGRCVYTYQHKNARLYPGIARGSQEWVALYKSRVAVERSIFTFKDFLGVAHRKTSNVLTTKADLFLAGIVQLLGVIIAYALHDLNAARKIRRLIA